MHRHDVPVRPLAVLAIPVLLLTALLPSAPALAAPGFRAGSADEARVTLFDITDFHGHIEQGPAVASAWAATRAANPSASLMVSAGDLVGGSPYDSAVLKDQPALEMAKAWGLSVSAMGNHELDRGVDDFNGRIASPDNGIDWVGANAAADGHAGPGEGRLSHLRPYVTRTLAGKRIAFIGAVTDTLASVEEPRSLEGMHLTAPAVKAVNAVAERLSDGDESNGEADAIVALIHEDADAIADSPTPLSPAIDLVYAGHSHAVKTGRATASGAPIIEAGSYGMAFASQDLIISGRGRDATVRVENTPVGAGAIETGIAADASGRVRNLPKAADGEGGAEPQAARHDDPAASIIRSGGTEGLAAVTGAILAKAEATAAIQGNTVVGHLARGADFAVPAAHRPSATARKAGLLPAPPDSQLGALIADAALDSARAQHGTRSQRARVGFVNFGSLRVPDLDANGDGTITERETHTMMALQFRNATIDLTGAQLKRALAQQWRADATQMSYLGVSSNVDYGYHAVTDRSGRRGVAITGLTVDGHAVRDDETITVAANSFLLNGGDGYTAFRAGTGYRDTGVPYADTLDRFLSRTPVVGVYFT